MTVIAARVFGVCGFVVAAPLLDLLGKNPTFFVAHDVDSTSLLLFGLAVILIPAAVVMVPLVIVRLIASRWLAAVAAVTIGALAALALVPMINRSLGISTWLFVTLLVLVTGGVTYGYLHWPILRTYLTYLAAAPIIFLVIFLFVSPSNALLAGADTVDAAVLHGSTTPVIVVTFDEFPLGVLLDENGNLDTVRYPGFGRLADVSTWYPRADTVAGWTHLAVPAILTGLLPSDPVPVAATHPRSLFTMFDRTHHLEVSEAITHLCPESACKQKPPDEGELIQDTKVVYLHSLLPDALAAKWLPEIGERWSGFSDAEPEVAPTDGKDVTFEDFNREEFFAAKSQRDLQPGRFETFLSSITPKGKRPGLWFHHSLLPHLPYHYLPDVRPYNGDSMPSMVDFDWVDDPDLLAGAAQRLAIQTAAVDQLVSELLDRLEAQGMLDRALVVVTADHGVTFEPRHGSRGGSPANSDNPPPMDAWTRDDVLPVPLFIKYPDERRGRVDDRAAQTVDVMPTIVDALGISLPASWKFDGESLLGHPSKHRDVHYTHDSGVKQRLTITHDPDPLRMARYMRSILGPPGGEHDLYAIAPYGALVGQRSDTLTSDGATGTATIDGQSTGAYDNVAGDGLVPALFEASLTGVGPDDWIAVAVDGTIAGTGPVYGSGNALRTIAMLDPMYLTPGHHTMSVYRIATPSSLQPLTTR